MLKTSFYIGAAIAAVVLGLGSTIGSAILIAGMDGNSAQVANQPPMQTLERIVVIGRRN